MQWTPVLAGAWRVYDTAVQHESEDTGAGTRATPTAFASQAVLASAAPPSPAEVMGDPVEVTMVSTLFWTVIGAFEV